MRITKENAKEFIGQPLYWVEPVTNRPMVMLRGGILTSVNRGRLEFNHSGDYIRISELKELTNEKHGNWIDS